MELAMDLRKIISDYSGYEVIGTEISDTASKFAKTVQWDFHDINNNWISKFDFVYMNSLDHAWKPRDALVTWFNQLNNSGMLIIEHTEASVPTGTSEMDPFGVRPTIMPYVLIDWFGHDISIKFITAKKENNGLDVWIFYIRRNVATIN